MNILVRTCAVAAVAISAFLPVSPIGATLVSTALAQNQAAVCVNGYRMTHVVISKGYSSGGVLLRCRG
jgi:hypothetical protein